MLAVSTPRTEVEFSISPLTTGRGDPPLTDGSSSALAWMVQSKLERIELLLKAPYRLQGGTKTVQPSKFTRRMSGLVVAIQLANRKAESAT